MQTLLSTIRAACASSDRTTSTSFRFAELLSDRLRSAGQVQTRTLNTASNPRGGYAVSEDRLPLLGALYDSSLLAEVGAQPGKASGGDVRSVKVTAGANFQWLGQGGTCIASDMSLSRTLSTPRRLQAIVPLSAQLIMQTSGDAEEAVIDDLRRGAGEAVDLGGLVGVGGAEPIGLLENSAITTKTFGGAATASKLEELSQSVRNGRVLGPLTWVVSPKTASKWRTTVGVTGVNTLFDCASAIGSVRETALLENDDRVVLGAFQHIRLIEWKDDIGMIVDPYSRKSESIVEISLSIFADVLAERSEAFAVSTDSGAQ